ncbi:MAG: flavin reductase family protein, partial [Eubacteriaceae bacterium]|nr:flavin reductase family protein [Bacteroidota bacterium]NLN98633.1 flavin reductase family protein [Eubacteriaceae bacterium]
MIKNTKKFAVSILGQNNHDIVKHFGSQSGHVTDKFEGIDHFLGEETGCPGLPEALVFVEVEVESVTELGTHLMFVGKVVGGKDLTDGKPMTYAYYRETR